MKKGIRGNLEEGCYWTASCIAAPFKWTWSSVCDPVATLTGIPHRIYQCASFFWGWTFGLVLKTGNYALNTHFPSLKVPLFVSLVGSGATFIAYLVDPAWNVARSLAFKLIAISVMTAVASYLLTHRYTNLAPSKVEVGGWSLLPSLSIIVVISRR